MKGNLFNSIQVRRPQRNLFDMGHDVKMSSKFGLLYPCLVMEVIPGDKVKIAGEIMSRFMPLSAPIMHEVDETIDYWFIPKRILWPGWDEWIFSHPEAPAHPVVTVDTSNIPLGSLGDYLGLPTPILAEEEVVSAFPFAAYQCVIDNFYRDQNLQPAIAWQLGNGDNSANLALFELRRRAWQHDYFTSCLPFAQKGNAVNVPIGEIVYDGTNNIPPGLPGFVELPGTVPAATGNVQVASIDGGSGPVNAIQSSGEAGTELAYDPNGTLINEGVDISVLRRAFKLQEWRELAARVGTRIKEGLRGFFDVKSQDSRLDLPEFITAVKSRVNISEVLNNTGTEEAPQGSMAGHGIAYNRGRHGSYYCPEHGYIIAIKSTRPKTAYQQGIEKHWLKNTDPYEHFWHQFEHIGEQAVQNREVYAFQGEIGGSDVFGYIPRYAEYKFMNSRVAGDFRANLNDWHLGRIFASPPSLNADFIECDPDADRVFAAGDDDDYILSHIRHHIIKISGMSKFGSPSF